jgi:hypothetical protein
VTLWEAMAYGQRPYEVKTSTNKIKSAILVEFNLKWLIFLFVRFAIIKGLDGPKILELFSENRRLGKPDSCPFIVYSLMLNCWQLK